jgi:hypothetical protein
MDINDYYTRYIMIIHYNIIETNLVYFLLYSYRPRNLPENFNDYIFDDLEKMVINNLKFFYFY